ncbi:MAG: galactose-1-phosphate uridylyltransferase [Campylobacterota bacterium]
MSEFRYNKLTKNWVLFAPNRARRPFSFNRNDDNHTKKDIESCPFEKGNEEQTPNELARIGTLQNWKCRVVPNLYHALSIDKEVKSYRTGCFENMSAFGAHEVIIETPVHSHQMFDFSIDEFFDYFSIIKLRINDLKKDIRLNYFSIFKNYGQDGGASILHSHSQLIATPFIPKTIASDLEEYSKYKQETNRCFFDDLIYEEKTFMKGLLFENNYFIAFCPYASSYSFEINIVATGEISSILDLDDIGIYSLSEIIQYCFIKLKKALGECDFNMLIKNGAIQDTHNSNRFHIQIIPRLYKTAGFELDSDIMINTFLPETAAKILKES